MDESQKTSIGPNSAITAVGKFLTDEQWSVIAKLGTLPDNTRSDIEHYVMTARQFYEAERPQAQQSRRHAIRKAAECAAVLQQLAVQIRESNVIWFETEFEEEQELLEKLKSFEAKMRGRINNFKSGPVTDGFHFMVQTLNHVLIHHANRTLNLSSNRQSDGFDATEFLVKFFEYSGYPRNAGLRSKVRNAIKEVVDVMGSWDVQYRPRFSSRKNYAKSHQRLGWMFTG